MIQNRRRDPKSGAIQNTDVAALNKYKQEKVLYKRVTTLNNEVTEIKQLLVSVCDRLEKLENK